MGEEPPVAIGAAPRVGELHRAPQHQSAQRFDRRGLGRPGVGAGPHVGRARRQRSDEPHLAGVVEQHGLGVDDAHHGVRPRRLQSAGGLAGRCLGRRGPSGERREQRQCGAEAATPAHTRNGHGIDPLGGRHARPPAPQPSMPQIAGALASICRGLKTPSRRGRRNRPAAPARRSRWSPWCRRQAAPSPRAAAGPCATTPRRDRRRCARCRRRASRGGS